MAVVVKIAIPQKPLYNSLNVFFYDFSKNKNVRSLAGMKLDF